MSTEQTGSAPLPFTNFLPGEFVDPTFGRQRATAALILTVVRCADRTGEMKQRTGLLNMLSVIRSVASLWGGGESTFHTKPRSLHSLGLETMRQEITKIIQFIF